MAFTRHTSKDVAGYNKVLLELNWNREGNYLGMISSDRSVKVGQLDKSGTFQNVHNIPTTSTMTQLCWNPVDDSRIGMCGEDKYVELWDVRGEFKEQGALQCRFSSSYLYFYINLQPQKQV